MASAEQWTYRSLIKPIPPRINLANVSAQQPSKPCQFCSAIVPDRRRAKKGLIKTVYERIDLYPDFPELKASAKAGCGLCRLMRKMIRSNWAVRPMEEWGVGQLREKDGLWLEMFDASWDRKVKIHKMAFNIQEVGRNPASSSGPIGSEDDHSGMLTSLNLEFGPATQYALPDGSFKYGEIGQVLRFKAFDSEDINAMNEESRRRLPTLSTLSTANVELISKWIGECKSSHFICHLDVKTWLPTRLIDVGSQDGTKYPRLVETAEEGICGRYVALSHMWGDPTLGHAAPLRTLTANYTEMLSEIPKHLLSKNFDDAVTATLQLGLKYLWIDSLCIVQDDRLDWEKEAATMHKVYKFAEVTLVATSAISAHDGFLERELSNIPAVKVHYSLDTKPETERNIILAAEDETGSGNWASDIEGCPWNKRGWTMQERSLSTRMLHFCKNKLYFECRTCLRSEENESLERSTPRTFEMWPGGEDHSTVSHLGKRKVTKGIELYSKWTRVVTEYSQRRLTKEFDKLPAIQSIAAEMSTVLNDTYITFAGIWTGHIKHGLLWQVRDGLISIPEKYRAPTWSWASLDAKVGWDPGVVNPKQLYGPVSHDSFQLLNIAESAVETGEQHSHLLKVKALLKPIAFIIECPYDDRWIWASQGNFPYNLYSPTGYSIHDGREYSHPTPLPVDRKQAVVNKQYLKFAEGRLDLDNKDDLTTSQRSLFYLHVDHTRRPSGLILESVKDQKAFWKRVGVATLFTKDSELFLEDCFAQNETRIEVTLI